MEGKVSKVPEAPKQSSKISRKNSSSRIIEQ
jgi:hypothetical protein